MDKVSVVIPVYSQWHLLKRNIDALLKFDRDNIGEILVINDCSPDANPYEFDETIVKIITNEKNLGYAGTVNNGLKRASADIIVLLDSDAYPLERFIPQLLNMYNAKPEIGCIGFGTVDDDGKDTGNWQYEPSVWGWMAGQLLEARFGFLRFWRNRNLIPYSCAVSFKKQCLIDVDYLDEDNFAVLDSDIDISMRIHRSKWKLLFTKKIIICHKGGNSYKINHKRILLFYRSRWNLLRKHRMIMFPGLAKFFFKLRINSELTVFKYLAKKNTESKYWDKITGREILIKELNTYK